MQTQWQLQTTDHTKLLSQTAGIMWFSAIRTSIKNFWNRSRNMRGGKKRSCGDIKDANETQIGPQATEDTRNAHHMPKMSPAGSLLAHQYHKGTDG